MFTKFSVNFIAKVEKITHEIELEWRTFVTFIRLAWAACSLQTVWPLHCKLIWLLNVFVQKFLCSLWINSNCHLKYSNSFHNMTESKNLSQCAVLFCFSSILMLMSFLEDVPIYFVVYLWPPFWRKWSSCQHISTSFCCCSACIFVMFECRLFVGFLCIHIRNNEQN